MFQVSVRSYMDQVEDRVAYDVEDDGAEVCGREDACR